MAKISLAKLIVKCFLAVLHLFLSTPYYVVLAPGETAPHLAAATFKGVSSSDKIVYSVFKGKAQSLKSLLL